MRRGHRDDGLDDGGGQGRGRRAPGPIMGLLSSGIGMAAEYHEHRKEKKQISRDNAGQSEADAAGPSTEHQHEQYDDQQHEDDDYDEEDDQRVVDDEEDWHLDEAVAHKTASHDGPPSHGHREADLGTTDELVREVMLTSRAGNAHAGGGEAQTPHQPLPFPVILPQRRPRKKARGFVRAYAPVLADYGIDQETFLKFLDTFDKSSGASPVFTVILVTATVVSMVPSAIAQAVATVAQIGAEVGAEMQSRQRTNTFLDRINVELFKPARLYAMLIKYKPEIDLGTESSKTDMGKRFGIRPEAVDLSNNQIIAKYGGFISPTADDAVDERSMKEKMQKLRLASGTTKGAAALPEAAPLIYPDVDQAIVANGAEETFKDKAKDAQAFLTDYLDRRAQVTFAQQDPKSSLMIPEEQRKFKSKLADPEHPMYQGGLVSLVSGGAVAGRRGRGGREGGQGLLGGRGLGEGRGHGGARLGRGRLVGGVRSLMGGKDDSHHADGAGEGGTTLTQGTMTARILHPNSQVPHGRGIGRLGGGEGRVNSARKLLREDVLYLMIVNLPSEAELVKARQELPSLKRH